MNYLVAVDDCFIDRPSGMGRVAWDIALLMRSRGHHVTVFTLNRLPPGSKPPTESDGIKIIRYDRPHISRWHPRKADRAIAAARDAAKVALFKQSWDVVHIHSPFTGAGVQAALGSGPRYIYTMHSPIVLEQKINWRNEGWTGRIKRIFGVGPLKRIERNVLNRCAAIQTLSNYTRKHLVAFHGLDDRITVIPHWRRSHLKRTRSKEEARRKLGWPLQTPIFFTVRIHGPRYGIDIAIRAIAPFAKEGRCRFYVGGDGPLRGSFEELVRELGCSENIIFTGRLSDEDLSLAYEAADLFILPTLALECFGLITIEALSFGCPVLSTDAGAIPETMSPVLPQFVVPAGDEEAMRKKIEDFLEGRLVPPPPAALERYIASRFDVENVIPKLITFIEGPAGGPWSGPISTIEN